METNPHHPFVKLAIEAIDHYTKSGETLAAPENLPLEQKTPRGVFVSIKKSGRLRGCIGTIRPVRENLAEEITPSAPPPGTPASILSPTRNWNSWTSPWMCSPCRSR